MFSFPLLLLGISLIIAKEFHRCKKDFPLYIKRKEALPEKEFSPAGLGFCIVSVRQGTAPRQSDLHRPGLPVGPDLQRENIPHSKTCLGVLQIPDVV